MKCGFRELVFLMLMIGLLAASYLFVIKPAVEKRAQYDEDMKAKRQEMANLKNMTGDIKDLEKKIQELQTAIKFFEGKLPQQKELDTILKQVWQLADQNSLQTRTIKTLKGEQSAGYSEQPIQISLAGDFSGFYSFLLQLERLSRITQITQMKLDKIMDRDGEMQAQITLSVFFESEGAGRIAGAQ